MTKCTLDRSLPSQLRNLLDTSLPGATAHRKMSPILSYGRHKGPPPDRVRQAAVVLMLLYRDGRWNLPLTRRPTTVKHHNGQISFPGGRIEADEDAEQASLREYEEELGVRPKNVTVCGRLSPLYVYASDNWVQPVVMTSEHSLSPWKPDSSEVDQVLEIDLSTLLDAGSWDDRIHCRPIKQSDQSIAHFEFRTPGLCFDQHYIWGATAMILREFVELLSPIGVHADPIPNPIPKG